MPAGFRDKICDLGLGLRSFFLFHVLYLIVLFSKQSENHCYENDDYLKESKN